MSQSQHFKPTLFCSEKLSIIDAWRFFNPDGVEFSWSNPRRTQQSRIDLWLISSSCLQHVSEVSHSHAPLTDHKLITLHLTGSKEKNKNVRGYWKLNTNLIKNEFFQLSVKLLAQDIFNRPEMNNIQKWEYFKFKVRETAIKCSKDIKKASDHKEKEILDKLEPLLKKDKLSDSEQTKLLELQNDVDELYIEAAKGAFIRSRARWLEKGERNSSYFFALEKRNKKRNAMSALKINDQVNTNPRDIAEYVSSFYSRL